eukprot:365015-Chlamydomonas_euryale.AAC.5
MAFSNAAARAASTRACTAPASRGSAQVQQRTAVAKEVILAVELDELESRTRPPTARRGGWSASRLAGRLFWLLVGRLLGAHLSSLGQIGGKSTVCGRGLIQTCRPDRGTYVIHVRGMRGISAGVRFQAVHMPPGRIHSVHTFLSQHSPRVCKPIGESGAHGPRMPRCACIAHAAVRTDRACRGAQGPRHAWCTWTAHAALRMHSACSGAQGPRMPRCAGTAHAAPPPTALHPAAPQHINVFDESIAASFIVERGEGGRCALACAMVKG